MRTSEGPTSCRCSVGHRPLPRADAWIRPPMESFPPIAFADIVVVGPGDADVPAASS